MSQKTRFIKQGEGGAQPNISKEKIITTLFPIPPLSEQHRIVAKIEELLPYIDRYDEAEQKLTQLNKAFPDKLKKSLLQYAIQGKLVPQNAEDEPASVLLEKIRADKEKLIKEKKIKRDRNDSVIYRRDNEYYEKQNGVENCISEQIPFDIPDGWEWVRLQTICEYIQRGKSPQYSDIHKYPVVAQKCNQWSGFSIEKAKFIEPSTISDYGQERLLQDGDLMWNSTGLGTLGRIAVYYSKLNPYELAVADSHVTVIRHIKDYIATEYLYTYFSNPTVQSVIEEQSDGTTKQKELATNTIKNYLLPLPPLSEQHRIVSKIEEILPQIDRLQ